MGITWEVGRQGSSWNCHVSGKTGIENVITRAQRSPERGSDRLRPCLWSGVRISQSSSGESEASVETEGRDRQGESMHRRRRKQSVRWPRSRCPCAEPGEAGGWRLRKWEDAGGPSGLTTQPGCIPDGVLATARLQEATDAFSHGAGTPAFFIDTPCRVKTGLEMQETSQGTTAESRCCEDGRRGRGACEDPPPRGRIVRMCRLSVCEGRGSGDGRGHAAQQACGLNPGLPWCRPHAHTSDSGASCSH